MITGGPRHICGVVEVYQENHAGNVVYLECYTKPTFVATIQSWGAVHTHSLYAPVGAYKPYVLASLWRQRPYGRTTTVRSDAVSPAKRGTSQPGNSYPPAGAALGSGFRMSCPPHHLYGYVSCRRLHCRRQFDLDAFMKYYIDGWAC